MSVYISPVGLAAAPVANQLSAMVTIKDKLCKSFCASNTNQPNATVTYSTGTATLVGTTVFIPITVSVLILTPSNCCEAVPQMSTQSFVVAFQGQTAVPTTVTVQSVGTNKSIACKNQGKAHNYVINDSITVTIA